MLIPPRPPHREVACCCYCDRGVIAVLVLVVLLIVVRSIFAIVVVCSWSLLLLLWLSLWLLLLLSSLWLWLLLTRGVPTFCHKPPSPRKRTLFVGKRQYKKTVQFIIFHPRASKPGAIRASNLEAPYQTAKRPFGPPYLPPNSGIFAPLCQHPPSNFHFVRKVQLRLAYRLAFVIFFFS